MPRGSRVSRISLCTVVVSAFAAQAVGSNGQLAQQRLDAAHYQRLASLAASAAVRQALAAGAKLAEVASYQHRRSIQALDHALAVEQEAGVHGTLDPLGAALAAGRIAGTVIGQKVLGPAADIVAAFHVWQRGRQWPAVYLLALLSANNMQSAMFLRREPGDSAADVVRQATAIFSDATISNLAIALSNSLALGNQHVHPGTATRDAAQGLLASEPAIFAALAAAASCAGLRAHAPLDGAARIAVLSSDPPAAGAARPSGLPAEEAFVLRKTGPIAEWVNVPAGYGPR